MTTTQRIAESLLLWTESLYLRAHGWTRARPGLWMPPEGYIYHHKADTEEGLFNHLHAVNSQKFLWRTRREMDGNSGA